jgi:hypothetical protein
MSENKTNRWDEIERMNRLQQTYDAAYKELKKGERFPLRREALNGLDDMGNELAKYGRRVNGRILT